jgi:hypothetical protein
MGNSSFTEHLNLRKDFCSEPQCTLFPFTASIVGEDLKLYSSLQTKKFAIRYSSNEIQSYDFTRKYLDDPYYG